MLKTPEFDASYDPIVTESKGMLKTPEFHASYDPVVTESKGMQKKLQNLTHHMTLWTRPHVHMPTGTPD